MQNSSLRISSTLILQKNNMRSGNPFLNLIKRTRIFTILLKLFHRIFKSNYSKRFEWLIILSVKKRQHKMNSISNSQTHIHYAKRLTSLLRANNFRIFLKPQFHQRYYPGYPNPWLWNICAIKTLQPPRAHNTDTTSFSI